MTSPGLTPHERQILTQIEHDLRQTDDTLERGLRTMRPGRWWRTERLLGPVRRIPARTVLALALISLALTSVATDLRDTAATALMAAAWTATALITTVKISRRNGGC